MKDTIYNVDICTRYMYTLISITNRIIWFRTHKLNFYIHVIFLGSPSIPGSADRFADSLVCYSHEKMILWTNFFGCCITVILWLTGHVWRTCESRVCSMRKLRWIALTCNWHFSARSCSLHPFHSSFSASKSSFDPIEIIPMPMSGTWTNLVHCNFNWTYL